MRCDTRWGRFWRWYLHGQKGFGPCHIGDVIRWFRRGCPILLRPDGVYGPSTQGHPDRLRVTITWTNAEIAEWRDALGLAPEAD